MECPETCDVTCYHLELDGKELNDYVELAEYAELMTSDASAPRVLKIVPGVLSLQLYFFADFYDERATRLHVRRLRELLVNPPAHVNHYGIPIFGRLLS